MKHLEDLGMPDGGMYRQKCSLYDKLKRRCFLIEEGVQMFHLQEF
jgi:hypothetical protein